MSLTYLYSTCLFKFDPNFYALYIKYKYKFIVGHYLPTQCHQIQHRTLPNLFKVNIAAEVNHKYFQDITSFQVTLSNGKSLGWTYGACTIVMVEAANVVISCAGSEVTV